MSFDQITPIVMPKWGLSMREGRITKWLVELGATIAVGAEILDVETEKLVGAVEAADAGILRRKVGECDRVYPVKALIGVMAPNEVADSVIDEYVATYATPDEGVEGEEVASKYQVVNVEAGPLRYSVVGTGSQDVVLIHGFGGDVENWMFNIDALAEKYRVFSLDLPGHGESYKAIDDASIAGYAKAVLAFMTAVGVQSASLVGHSMGGAIALQILATVPERVRSLTLIASAGLGSQINQAYLEGFVRANSRKELKPYVELLFADQTLASRKLLDDLLKAKRMDGSQQALEKTVAAFAKDGEQKMILGNVIDGGALPVLAIHGRRDQIIPPEQSESLQNARVEILESAGHMPHVEAARDVNSLLLAHLAKVT